MDFTQIFNGMVGRDFIKAFNDNFIIADRTFLEILATLIYKVKSTDIKEFRVIDNVVSYTLEEAPEEGEDTREWTPVDITKWGNINGDIQDQEDLWNILEDKAAVETVVALNNIVSTLNQEFQQTKSQVETNTNNIRANTNSITDLLQAMTDKVSSTTIKSIRLNNAVFEWSPDGRTWYSQTIDNRVATWGYINGDISTQEDLVYLFNNIDTQIEELSGTISSLENTIEQLQSDVSTLSSSFNTHITEYNSYKNTVSDSLSLIDDKADNAVETSSTVSTNLNAHLEDYDNPHHITKHQINLDQVDNTSDVDKPLSTAQKQYVDNEIANVRRDVLDKSGLVGSSGYAGSLFVGTQSDYVNEVHKEGMLAFIIDSNMITAGVTLTCENYSPFGLYLNGNEVTPTTETATSKSYSNLAYGVSLYVVKVTVDGEVKNFDINISFKQYNDINVDDLVEDSIQPEPETEPVTEPETEPITEPETEPENNEGGNE